MIWEEPGIFANQYMGHPAPPPTGNPVTDYWATLPLVVTSMPAFSEEDRRIEEKARQLIEAALQRVLSDSVKAKDIIGKLVDVRAGLKREIQRLQETPDSDPFGSNYNEGRSDALKEVLAALDKKFRDMADEA